MKRKRFFRTFLLILFIATIIGIVLFFYSTNVTENEDDYIYTLPYAPGTTEWIAQGYGGLFSHKNIAAIDFNMREGTPVYAARGGIIYRYRDDSNEGGMLPKYKNKSSYIIIKHDDGSYGCYYHLQMNSVRKKNGRIKQGELIANSGNTGLVVTPHLHFSVKKELAYDKDSYVRTRFKTTKGVQLLETGKCYTRPID